MKISFVFPVSYKKNSSYFRYIESIVMLEDDIHRCYGIGFPRNYSFTDEPKKKMVLTKLTTRLSRLVVKPICKLFKLPKYYAYWVNIKMFDLLFSRKVANDSSSIVFTTPLLSKTVQMCKKKGKCVVVEAGNSEANREYTLISEEYAGFNIKNKYIYGNPMYKNTCLKSYELADRIIPISKVSFNTYKQTGLYDLKLELIPLTNTCFPITEQFNESRKKAFISTAYHSFIKGTHRLLLAWKKADISNIPLIIVGELHDDMQEFIAKYGPFNNVIFTGNINNLDIWYKDYEAVGILLSLSEGAVRVVPEMLSFGFPMITTIDASCDLVQDGFNGFIVNYKDEDIIIDKLHYFADDWSRTRPMQKNAIDTIRNIDTNNYSSTLVAYLRFLGRDNKC